jgi:hypothetical protein
MAGGSLGRLIALGQSIGSARKDTTIYKIIEKSDDNTLNEYIQEIHKSRDINKKNRKINPLVTDIYYGYGSQDFEMYPDFLYPIQTDELIKIFDFIRMHDETYGEASNFDNILEEADKYDYYYYFI